jgi:hypothetical protein
MSTIKSVEQLREEFQNKFSARKVEKSPQLQRIFEFFQENKNAERITPKPDMRRLLRTHLGYNNTICATYKSTAA